ncbi:hypothetical protein M569_09569, partial [Genlisea aurea]
FKIPKGRVASVVASLDEDDVNGALETDEVEITTNKGVHSRQYRGSSATDGSNSASVLTKELKVGETLPPLEVFFFDIFYEPYLGSASMSKSFRNTSPSSERVSSNDYDHRKNSTSSTRKESDSDRERRTSRSSTNNRAEDLDEEYRRKRSRHDRYTRTPVRSEWDDGRWEWEDTPRRDGPSSGSRHQRHFPSPMLARASPDARLVSPWLGGTPLPTPIRASGSSNRSASSHSSRKSSQVRFASDKTRSSETGEDAYRGQDHGISESIAEDMQNIDRAWYDQQENGTVNDLDASSFFLDDEASFQKKEAELAKRLVRKDGTKMTLAQSKKMSQLTADNAQWEDRQLLRSGAVRGTEVQTEFDNEEERKVILLVH